MEYLLDKRIMSMSRKNSKLKLPWNGDLENDHYIIRDSDNSIVTIIPSHRTDSKQLGSFILRASNTKNIKDALLNKIENIVLVAGSVIILLVMVTILLDIDYSPMLILGGGLLTTVAYIGLIHSKSKK